MVSRARIQLRTPMRVAVVGGGPAGAFFAYSLLNLARIRGHRLEVNIFEPKEFGNKGAPNCNYCQGVVAAGLVKAMAGIGLSLPDRVIQDRIRSYRLVTLGGSLRLWAPEDREIYTVYRGQGPHPEVAGPISFDQFLLESALQAGASQTPAWVERVSIRPGAVDPVLLADREGRSYPADVVVGAFGVNSAFAAEFESLGAGYLRPGTSSALQAEYRVPEEFISRRFGHEIKVFALGLYPVRFGVITPKRGYITVSLIGKNLGKAHLERFMRHPEVVKFLPGDLEPSDTRCHCAPLFPTTHGKGLAGAHYLIIGDAGVSRYYKNGIESALASAELAAGVLLEHGPSAAGPLQRCYARRIQARFRLDNFLGRILFRIHDLINRFPMFTRAHLSLAGDSERAGGYSRRRLRWILWNMFTGDAAYHRIFLRCLDPVLLVSVFLATAAEFFGRDRRAGTLSGEQDG
ncbi:MAG: FAD/NAD(P)-binding protein [Candidatus Glassbacteria bacterium]|nr:FAD/NAD(P)-binding protein [Candidatus Glassbacteria bacterium]